MATLSESDDSIQEAKGMSCLERPSSLINKHYPSTAGVIASVEAIDRA